MDRAFLDELKQRRVVRVAGIYAVGGWAVFQIVNSLLPALGFQSWTVSLYALLFLAGFPVAILLAWFTELTPAGLRFVPRDRRRFGHGRFGWVDWLVAGAVVLLLAFSAIQLVNLRREAMGGSPFRGGAPERSVAVLPFANFSAESGDGFFADGLTEELIDSLVQAPELKVAGRTSSFYFKGRNEDLREVGRKLGVAHVVEGSVRREGPRLRVTAQLIKVADGFHLWSQTYDRTLDDAFAIQNELANAVAEKLKAELIGAAASAPAERDPQAYRIELVARERLRTGEVGQLKRAREMFAELARLEPGNARAHAGYAQATVLLGQNFGALDFDEAHRLGEAAIGRALAVNPRSADAWRARGTLHRVLATRTGEGSHNRRSLAAFRRALEFDPQDLETQTLLAGQYLRVGEPERAIGLLRSVLATDPLSRTAQHGLANALSAVGRFDDARIAYEKVIALFPDYTSGRTGFASMLMFQQGRLDEAALVLDDPKLAEDDVLAALMLAGCYVNLSMPDGVRRAVAYIPAGSPLAPVGVAILMQASGQRERLLTFAIEQQRKTRDPIWASLIMAERTLLGDYRSARAMLPRELPGLFEDVPNIEGMKEIDLAIAAHVLAQTGSANRAALVLGRAFENPPSLAMSYESGAEGLAQRGYALAAGGRTEEAVTAFENAAAQGWRMPVEFEYFVRGDAYPFMAEVRRHPRFRALMARIEADLRQMRARLEARRDGPEVTA